MGDLTAWDLSFEPLSVHALTQASAGRALTFCLLHAAHQMSSDGRLRATNGRVVHQPEQNLPSGRRDLLCSARNRGMPLAARPTSSLKSGSSTFVKLKHDLPCRRLASAGEIEPDSAESAYTGIR